MDPLASAGPEGDDAANPWRDEIVRTIFGDVGLIRKDFSCAIERKILLHGRMYITDRFICFYSNLFGFEKKIKIPYSHITCVTKENTAIVIPNAIAIITSKREYIFRSFWDRDECFQLLRECHDASRAVVAPHGENGNSSDPRGRRAASSATAVPASPGLGKQGSVDSAASSGGSGSNSADGGGGNGIGSGASGASAGGAMESKRSILGGTPSRRASRSPTPPTAEQRKRAERRPSAAPLGGLSNGSANDSAASAGSANSATSSNSTTGGMNGVKADGNRSATTDGDETEDEKGDMDDGEDPKEAFREAQNGLKYTVVEFDLPGLSLSQYFDLNAKTSDIGMPAFHQQRGDTEIDVEEWRLISAEDAAVVTHARNFRFRTPVVAPIGPSSTRATKTQCVRIYGSHGMVIETVTHLEDIPFSDCFNVEDRFVLTPVAGGLKLHISLEMRWIKNTMWKRTIETKTVKDTTDFYKDYQVAITKHLKENAGAAAKPDANADADADADSPAPPTVPPPAPPSAQPQAAAAPPRADATAAGGTSASPLVLALLVFLVLLGVRGYLSDLAAGKREAAMQAEIALLRTAVEDIRTLVATGQCGVGRG